MDEFFWEEKWSWKVGELGNHGEVIVVPFLHPYKENWKPVQAYALQTNWPVCDLWGVRIVVTLVVVGEPGSCQWLHKF